MTEPESTGTRGAAGARHRLVIKGGLVVLAVALSVAALAASSRVWSLRKDKQSIRLTEVLARTIESRGIDAAVVQYRSLRKQGFPDLRQSKADTNRLGYDLLDKGQTATAIQVFQLNVETYPDSAWVYDSLGDAYVAAGNKPLAIAAYRQAVAINPHKKTALSALGKLTGERKPIPPPTIFHISAGALALLAGAVALSLRKGSRPHRLAGNVFVVAMLSMSASGALMALLAPDGLVVNVLMGVLTFYLVVTGWLTARRKNGSAGIVDWGALVVALAVAAGLARYGLEAAISTTGTKDGISPGLYFSFAAVALLAAALDLRMIARGGVFGARRITRHLWRMCCALFIAVTSLFVGQPQVFPDGLRRSGLLVVPSVLVVVLLIFWLVRVRRQKAAPNLADGARCQA